MTPDQLPTWLVLLIGIPGWVWLTALTISILRQTDE